MRAPNQRQGHISTKLLFRILLSRKTYHQVASFVLILLQFKLQPRGFGWEELVFQPEIVIGTIAVIDPRRSPRSGSSRENVNVDLTQVSAMFPKVGEHEQDEEKEKEEEKISATSKGD